MEQRIAIIGGGFAGSSIIRELAEYSAGIQVVEPADAEEIFIPTTLKEIPIIMPYAHFAPEPTNRKARRAKQRKDKKRKKW